MPTAIDKALDFIGGMNTSLSVPNTMDESTAKGILKYLHELGVPANPADVMARGKRRDGMPGSRKKWPAGRKKLPPVTGSSLKTRNSSPSICANSCRRWCKPPVANLTLSCGAPRGPHNAKGPEISLRPLLYLVAPAGLEPATKRL